MVGTELQTLHALLKAYLYLNAKENNLLGRRTQLKDHNQICF